MGRYFVRGLWCTARCSGDTRVEGRRCSARAYLVLLPVRPVGEGPSGRNSPFSPRWRTAPGAPTLGTAAGMPGLVRLPDGVRRGHRAVHHSVRAGNLKMGLARPSLSSSSTIDRQLDRLDARLRHFISPTAVWAPCRLPAAAHRAPPRRPPCSPLAPDHVSVARPCYDRPVPFLVAGAEPERPIEPSFADPLAPLRSA